MISIADCMKQEPGSLQQETTGNEWPIYIISLRGAAERRTQCAATMARLGLRFEFFDAVEGAKLSHEEIAQVYDADGNARLYKYPLSRPEIGCYLSHFALWQRIASGAEEGAFLLEDDFQAQPGLADVMQVISSANLENCMVKLYARRPPRGAEIDELPGGYKLVMPHHVPGMTLGYAVDKAAAARLAARTLPIARPVDMEIKHWWQFDVPVLVVVPSLLRVDLRETGSAIEAARVKEKLEGQSSSIARVGRNLRYQIAYNAGVLRHRRREREHARRLKAILGNRMEP
jgi:glycosyl transferase, family 25